MGSELIANKKAAFFTGCFINYYYPAAGAAIVAVLRSSGVEVIVPEQVCCGLPMIAKGNVRGARKNIARNTGEFSAALAEGRSIITACSSCTLFLKRHYKLLGDEQAARVSESTYHFSEYLLGLHHIGQLNTQFQHLPLTVFYKTPCHLRTAGIGQSTVELLKLIPGITFRYISEVCCGMGGAYGFEKTNRTMALRIGARMFNELKENPADRVVTDCGGCKLQIEHGSGVKAEHPAVLIREAYSPKKS
jgi:glycerol-3-phosphate dehydrogenase subunit C